MGTKKTGDKQPEPLVRFGGEWIPARDIWNKMETANAVADVIEGFNERFPHLTSRDSLEVVPLVRQRLKDIDLRMPTDQQPEDLTQIAIELLQSKSPEDVVEVLREQHRTEMSVAQLIQLAGEEAYAAALQREAGVYSMNQISPEQTAELWNDVLRPAPGGGLWSAKKVRDLLDAGSG